jgi:hypothetical protein
MDFLAPERSSSLTINNNRPDFEQLVSTTDKEKSVAIDLNSMEEGNYYSSTEKHDSNVDENSKSSFSTMTGGPTTERPITTADLEELNNLLNLLQSLRENQNKTKVTTVSNSVMVNEANNLEASVDGVSSVCLEKNVQDDRIASTEALIRKELSEIISAQERSSSLSFTKEEKIKDVVAPVSSNEKLSISDRKEGNIIVL